MAQPGWPAFVKTRHIAMIAMRIMGTKNIREAMTKATKVSIVKKLSIVKKVCLQVTKNNENEEAPLSQ